MESRACCSPELTVHLRLLHGSLGKCGSRGTVSEARHERAATITWSCRSGFTAAESGVFGGLGAVQWKAKCKANARSRPVAVTAGRGRAACKHMHYYILAGTRSGIQDPAAPTCIYRYCI